MTTKQRGQPLGIGSRQGIRDQERALARTLDSAAKNVTVDALDDEPALGGYRAPGVGAGVVPLQRSDDVDVQAGAQVATLTGVSLDSVRAAHKADLRGGDHQRNHRTAHLEPLFPAPGKQSPPRFVIPANGRP